MNSNTNDYENMYTNLAAKYTKLVNHLLGPDWYSLYWNSEDCQEEALQYIMRTYKGIKENKIIKWRRIHKRCDFCKNLKYLYNPCGDSCFICEAKNKIIRNTKIHRLCGVFELNYKF